MGDWIKAALAAFAAMGAVVLWVSAVMSWLPMPFWAQLMLITAPSLTWMFHSKFESDRRARKSTPNEAGGQKP